MKNELREVGGAGYCVWVCVCVRVQSVIGREWITLSCEWSALPGLERMMILGV